MNICRSTHHKHRQRHMGHEILNTSAMASKARHEYVTREIGVPVCTLSAADCQERWRALPQQLPMTGKRIEFQVPDLGGDENVMLQIPLPDGSKLEIPLPERCSEGDRLSLLQRSDSSWKVLRKKKHFSFVVPECSAGDVLTVRPADEVHLTFVVPENVEPYNVVTLEKQEDGEWAFQQCAVLPPFCPSPFQPEWTTGPYQEILNALKSRGYVDRLCSDSKGVLNVSVPFCGLAA